VGAAAAVPPLVGGGTRAGLVDTARGAGALRPGRPPPGEAALLRAWGNREHVPDLLKLLGSDIDSARALATDGLVALAGKEHLERIAAGLQDRESWVRGHALSALSRLAGEEEGGVREDILSRIERLTRHPNPESARWASICLIPHGRCGAAAQFRLLEEVDTPIELHRFGAFLLEILSRAHEPGTCRKLRGEVEVKEPIDSPAKLEGVLRGAGLVLKLDAGVPVWGRVRSGRRLRLEAVLGHMVGERPFTAQILEGDVVRFAPWDVALEYWKGRLGRLRE